MADIYKLASKIFRWEGGYANDPCDSGGPTMMGVTLATYQEYCRRNGKPKPGIAELKKITRTTVVDILRTLYWNPCKGDLIANQSVADLVVDSCWGSGLGYIKNIQSTIGTTADGVVGPKTIAALNRNPREVHAKLWDARKKYYYSISYKKDPKDPKKVTPTKNAKFYRGWLNRLDEYKFKA